MEKAIRTGLAQVPGYGSSALLKPGTACLFPQLPQGQRIRSASTSSLCKGLKSLVSWKGGVPLEKCLFSALAETAETICCHPSVCFCPLPLDFREEDGLTKWERDGKRGTGCLFFDRAGDEPQPGDWSRGT